MSDSTHDETDGLFTPAEDETPDPVGWPEDDA
jgi:hypothetical protein